MKIKNMFAGILATSLILGCGEEEEDKKDEGGTCAVSGAFSSVEDFGSAVGSGKVIASSACKVTVDLSDVEGTYIVSPYVLGDFATVAGGTTTEVLSPTIALAGDDGPQALQIFKAQPRSMYLGSDFGATKPSLTDLGRMKTLLFNRFFGGKYDQTDFQQLLSKYERMHESLYFAGSTNLRASFDRFLSSGATAKRRSGLLATHCNLEEIPLAGYDEDTFALDPTPLVDNEKFCVYVEDGLTVDEINYSTIITKIMTDYQTLYDDSFADVGDFSFKPIFVVADFSAVSAWDGTVGFFDSGATETQKTPVLVMPYELNGRSEQNVAGTVAHELHHGISYYYRVIVNGGNPEPLGIDEGLSHFFQDVFGDGTTNYADYTANYLLNWANPIETEAAQIPVFAANSATDSNYNRGSAYAFWYYLAGRFGDFTASNGYISGTGVDFVRSYVKSASSGPEGLNTYLDGKLAEIFGEFGIALVVGGSQSNLDAKFDFEAPITGTDPLGGASQFGFNPNAESDRLSSYSDYFPAATDAATEFPYYTFKPMILEGGESKSFTLELDNLAAFAVRIK